jgi:hypothetical protein
VSTVKDEWSERGAKREEPTQKENQRNEEEMTRK